MVEDVEKEELKAENQALEARIEELERAKTPPLVKIESPLEREEFEDFLDAFMGATAVQDRRKAALLAARALKNLGADPETHLEEAVKTAQFITNALNALPDGELAKQTKDMLIADTAGKVSEAAYKEPTSEERMERRMERMMEMIMPWKMAMSMFGGGWEQGEGQGKSAEVARLESELANVKEKLAEKPIEELQRSVTKIESSLAELKSGPKEDTLAKKFDELKDAIKEGKGKSEVTEKLESLTKAITEKKEADKFDTMKDKIDTMRSGLEDKIANLQTSMSQGAGKEDVMKQAGELFNGIGNMYKGFGTMADTLGYAPKEEKLTGDRYDKLMGLGKKALDVVKDAVKYRPAPTKQAVRTLPLSEPATIPIAEPAEAPTEVPSEKIYRGESVARPFAKKPKPAEIPPAPAVPVEKPPEAKPSEAPTKPEKAPMETKGSEKPPEKGSE